ncbi:hypothetical protein GCM10007275_00560 [Jeotgalicoccus coquinae]|uniref:General stress protein CsbA n=1 Tax=Jeotgalicoccus coquinae TaxID=709509 RepID=A0A6V7RTE5_9STAP|nr:DUF4041 domain-containing protein [Jeotgalicoccus coquinae]MBB6423280.1 general stress protein CsbA [Jeotgalicoccus coquinae]GGE09268.1 hypothetical protein GCM10007275_00560 [Jeotgalicoccus coquinae]CAD2081825.1 hypothetical protein JEOCOQ751_02170 [Jeotgalicoccus coquinae]
MEIVLILLLLVGLVAYLFILRNKLIEKTKEFENLKKKDRTVEEMNYLELEKSIEEKTKQSTQLDDELSKKRKKFENEIKSFEHKKYKLGNEQINLEEVKRMKIEEIETLQQKVNIINDDISMQDYGIYEPKYTFASALVYKDMLKAKRDQQKQMIKSKTAVEYNENWTVNGSKAEGKKMLNNNIRQILRSFNNECEVLIDKVTYQNFDSVKKRIIKIHADLNKLNTTQQVSITFQYLDLKIDELYLAYEYARKKEEEKEEMRLQREQEREEKKLAKEIEEKKKIVDKEISHYNNLMQSLKNKLKNTVSEDERINLEKEIEETEKNIQEKEHEKKDLDYREAHSSAGYVYIISNIGAFGEDVLKIGVTRRLEPIERIKELSSASVPFVYDIHALIFSYEAYELETELHNYFEKYRVNKVNNRKEFFKVPITEIESKLQDYGNLTIDFNLQAEAAEYRETLAIEKKMTS